jgi:hypothetical protein
VAYERGSRLGGIWTLEERSTAAYRSLHLITSRERTEFAEFPMADGTPDYPARDEIGRYLESYAEAWSLTDHIRFGREVLAARRREHGWELELEDGEERADLLVVASGHNDEANWPQPPYEGDFEGRQLHALDYGSADDFRGERVLVVGMGNSAMDIATDLSYTAERTLLSVRHGSWVIPKRLLGQPADQVIRPWVAVNVPWRIRQPLAQLILRMTVGSPERYGLPAPSRGLFQAHPTISDTILSRISHGTIQPKPAIEELAGGEVQFADGSREPVDAIVWCTGYRVGIPYLDREIVGEDPSELPLYKRVFHLERDDLFFVGLMQSTGSAFPIVELQSKLLAAHLSGVWAKPPRSEMRADCERRRRLAVRRWGEHGRPSMRVDFDRFMHELARELERGQKRAGGAAA